MAETKAYVLMEVAAGQIPACEGGRLHAEAIGLQRHWSTELPRPSGT